MPRIPREEYARIRDRVKLGGEKVAAVAASYGCTPASIYSILAKLRQSASPAEASPPPPADATQQMAFAAEAMTTADADRVPPALAPVAETVQKSSTAARPSEPTSPQSTAPSPPALHTPTSRARGRAPSPASGLKRGYALMMRTSDGEEAMKPFRSLEDLLSAAKPILRDAARSPEPVWFSIQPVDLAALEDAL